MILWLDEHLSPQLALWLSETFACEAEHVRDLGLARAPDRDVFHAARQANAILLTKDVDFIGLLERLGPPPQVMWLTCGNMPNANLKRLLLRNLMPAITALRSGEPFVEIAKKPVMGDGGQFQRNEGRKIICPPSGGVG